MIFLFSTIVFYLKLVETYKLLILQPYHYESNRNELLNNTKTDYFTFMIRKTFCEILIIRIKKEIELNNPTHTVINILNKLENIYKFVLSQLEMIKYQLKIKINMKSLL